MAQESPPPGQPLSERDEIARQRVALQEEYGALYDDVLALLFRHDPISINFVTNTDEYDPEVRAMLPRLGACTSADEVTRMTHAVFVELFDVTSAGSAESYAQIGAEIWARWQVR